MVRVTLWLQLLLVVLVLRQSAAASDRCGEFQDEISRLKRDIENITVSKHANELLARQCYERLTKQFHMWLDTAAKLKKTEAVNSGLKKQLEAKEEALKSNIQKEEQLQTAIDGLTQTVKSLNQTVQRLCAQPKDVCRYLLEAAKSGDVNTAKVLFKRVNDNCTEDGVQRYTPLTYAAGRGRVEVVRVLLEEGANVDRPDAYGITALHQAAWYGYLDLCRLLLDWGAKVDPQNYWKYTPLHDAAGEGYLAVVQLLVQRGVDVSLKNKRGQTVRDVAWSKGKKDVAEWLDSVRRV